MTPSPLPPPHSDAQGFGNSLSRALEFAATTVVFSLLGWFIDRQAHTGPVFVIGFTVLGLVGQFVRLYYAYDLEMKAHDAALPSRRSLPGASAVPAAGAVPSAGAAPVASDAPGASGVAR